MRAEKLEYISVSSINAFQADRLRWCYAWIENRVPRRVPQALTVGKVIHKAFENHFNEYLGNGSVGMHLQTLLPDVPPLGEEDEYAELAGLVEPLHFWKDQYPITETLEVEQSFEMPTMAGVPFRGRPDRVAMIFGKAFHIQNKTCAKGIKLGTYITLARRNMHELLYGYYLSKKYGAKGIEYGGTLYNVVRKLKYRGVPSKKDPMGKVLHSLDEMFLQTIIGIDEGQIDIALQELGILSIEMDRTADAYLSGRAIPSTRREDGGRNGNYVDAYTNVMLGEASLDDDSIFADREETY